MKIFMSLKNRRKEQPYRMGYFLDTRSCKYHSSPLANQQKTVEGGGENLLNCKGFTGPEKKKM